MSASPAGTPAHRERGSASIELVVLVPLAFLVLFGVVQGAIFFHGQNLASAAAREGARVAAAENGSNTAARQAALGFVHQAGDGMLTAVTTTTIPRDGNVMVTVTANVASLVPGMPIRVNQTAGLPLERVT